MRSRSSLPCSVLSLHLPWHFPKVLSSDMSPCLHRPFRFMANTTSAANPLLPSSPLLRRLGSRCLCPVGDSSPDVAAIPWVRCIHSFSTYLPSLPYRVTRGFGVPVALGTYSLAGDFQSIPARPYEGSLAFRLRIWLRLSSDSALAACLPKLCMLSRSYCF